MRGDAEKLELKDDACAPVHANNTKFAKKRLQSATGATLEEVDDAVERSHRNLNRFMDEVTKYTSPQSTPDRRKSTISSAGMTNAQIAEHYSNCLKLSAENKINLKNAFDLHLIDYMSSILNHGEANFQTASSTIDASAKIYAYRVDSLYKETYKIYGGLGRSDKALLTEDGELIFTARSVGMIDVPPDHTCEIADNCDEIVANKAPATPVAKKKKKKITRGSCIETNERALNYICNEAKLQTDELFESVRSSFEEGNTSGLFLNTLPTLSDDNRLILHSFCEISTTVNENSVDENIIEFFRSALNKIKPAFENTSTCEAVSHFDFCNFDPRNLDQESSQAESSFDVSSSHKNNGALFAAKNIEPIDIEQANPDTDTTIVATTDFDNPQALDLDPRDAAILNESVDFDDGEDKPDFSEAKFAAGDSAKFKALEAALSTKDLEYSYFDPSLLQTWMGPNHWKLKRNVAKNENTAEAVNEETNKGRFANKQQKGKRKQLTDSRISFNEKVDFKKILKTASKSSTVLSAVLLSKYKSQDLLFEPDVDRQNPYRFNNLMLKPLFQLAKKYDELNQSYFDAAVVDCNLESESDMQNYCPNIATTQGIDGAPNGADDISFADIPDDNDYSALPTSENGIAMDDQIASTTADLDKTLGESNMVEQPYKIDKIDINYAKQAKRVDVKRLKTAMWRILNQDQLQNESSSKLKPREAADFPSQSFSELCQQLPKHISNQMLDNLSTPTIFTVLLHMCNEKTLKLEGAADFSDFKISQG